MTTPGLILDYASPRPRGRLRLPAHCELAVTFDSDGVTIVETLKGRSSAIGAVIFGAMVVLPASANVASAWRLAMRRGDAEEWSFFAVSAAVLVALIVVMILVIDQTWRRTIVRASRETLSITFRGLLRRGQFSWATQYVGDVRVISTQNATDAAPLGELEIHLVDRPLVKLFTDHLHPRLEEIAGLLRRAMGLAA